MEQPGRRGADRAGRLRELAGRLERAGPANNLALLVGHGTLRLTANGLEELRPGAAERMAALAAEAFEAGAVGLSSGLIYVPGSYAGTGELVALARVAAAYGGVYATHMRDEGAHLEAALDEAVTIAATAGPGSRCSRRPAGPPTAAAGGCWSGWPRPGWTGSTPRATSTRTTPGRPC